MKPFHLFTFLMWLALPVTALRYWLVWDQLPARMATHFAADGGPNGWMSRQVAFEFGLGLTAFVLIVFTVILLVAYRQTASDKFAWAFLVFSYVIVGIVFYANQSILNYNLTARPVSVAPILIITSLAATALIAVYLMAHRGARLPVEAAIATETHASPIWAVVCLAPLALELWVMASVPLTSIRIAGALMSILFLAVAAFAWSGFQYRFTSAGLEISTLGFRLRSIPANQIEHYNAGKWNLLRGYGIRGIGNYRAYVWGNQIVRIKTHDGEVFLGHNDPGRILRDLDAMKQFAH
jgi:hypothetical protein